MSAAAKVFTTVSLAWAQVAPGRGVCYEFEAVEGANVFRAFRHRSGYGWSWWSVTRNGEPCTWITAGCATELPRTFQEWR